MSPVKENDTTHKQVHLCILPPPTLKYTHPNTLTHTHTILTSAGDNRAQLTPYCPIPFANAVIRGQA